MEKIKNIIENNGDNSRRFESVEEELLDFQFQYIEKLEKGKLQEIKNDNLEESGNCYVKEQKEAEDSLNTSFEKNLFKYTNLSHDLNKEYYKRVENNYENVKNFDEWFKNILFQINNDYLKNKNWKDNVGNIIKENLDKIGPILPEENKEKDNNDGQQNRREKVGLINFNLSETGELENFGINKKDKCLNIHFKNLFSQKKENNNINNIFSGESLPQLAVEIIKKYPDVKAIIGRSWLINSPIAKRIGFQVFHNYDIANHSGSFWGQFINEKGEINKERMKKFLNTGVPEFLPAAGFIKIEDFLKKYLPRENRGIIKLKEITEESKKFKKDIDLLRKDLDEKWENLSFDEIILLMNSNSTLADYLKTNDGQDFLNLLKKLKESNLGRSLRNIDNIDFENKYEIKKKFDDFLKIHSSKFIEKEVLID